MQNKDFFFFSRQRQEIIRNKSCSYTSPPNQPPSSLRKCLLAGATRDLRPRGGARGSRGRPPPASGARAPRAGQRAGRAGRPRAGRGAREPAGTSRPGAAPAPAAPAARSPPQNKSARRTGARPAPALAPVPAPARGRCPVPCGTPEYQVPHLPTSTGPRRRTSGGRDGLPGARV